jgi:hypothetical protein
MLGQKENIKTVLAASARGRTGITALLRPYRGFLHDKQLSDRAPACIFFSTLYRQQVQRNS